MFPSRTTDAPWILLDVDIYDVQRVVVYRRPNWCGYWILFIRVAQASHGRNGTLIEYRLKR
jgi:hypothetical protein